jgi:hypothetical protein
MGSLQVSRAVRDVRGLLELAEKLRRKDRFDEIDP